MIIKKAELQSVKDRISKQISQDAIDAVELNRKISDFKSSLASESNFSGAIFDRIAQKLNNYELAINSRKDLANNLCQKITSSISGLINKMGSDDIIDTSQLENLKATYNNYNNEVARLRQQLGATTDLDMANQSTIRRSIAINSANADKVKLKIDKIEEIISLDAMYQSQLSSLDALLSNYKQKVNEIAASRSSISISSIGTML